MLRRLAIVVLLGVAGLAVGVAMTAIGGHRYNASGELSLPANSRESAPDLVAMVRGQHPGVRVIAAGDRVIYVSANGSLTGSANAAEAAVRELIGLTNGRASFAGGGEHALIRTTLGNRVHYGAVGLLAGIGAGLGFVFPRRRVNAAPP
jgi:hypothetical protein